MALVLVVGNEWARPDAGLFGRQVPIAIAMTGELLTAERSLLIRAYCIGGWFLEKE